MMINWTAVSAVVSGIALLCSGSVLFFGYVVSNKILNNDLVHVQEALDRIEKAGKEQNHPISPAL